MLRLILSQFFPLVNCYLTHSLYQWGFCGESHKNKWAAGNTLLSPVAHKEITSNDWLAHTIARQILQR